MVQDLRVRAQELGDQAWLYREEQKRNGWQWENALRRHNFLGFTGEMMKGVTVAKLRGGSENYDQWIKEAKAKTETRIAERRKKGGGSDGDLGP